MKGSVTVRCGSAPFVVLLIALIEQAVSGAGLDFVASLLTGFSGLASPA